MKDDINQNELEGNYINNEPSDEELNRLFIETAKKIGNIGIEGTKYSAQYQYMHVDTEHVIDNIEEYIIPECQQACRLLWSKNIETFMTSNYEDKDLYISFGQLSNENQTIFNEMSKNDKRYFFDEFRHYYGIRSKGINEESVNNLNSLTEVFLIQDVEKRRYKTADEFLAGFKCQDGSKTIDEYGHIITNTNPKLKDVSFIDALQASKSQDLYIEDEDRVYESQMYIKWHNRYIKNVELDK